ncbi:VCBS repeat-containing protein [Mycoplasmatota bacterium]|nr:VCBS repeat-containing protein [Mycoplasmatota bacterium]
MDYQNYVLSNRKNNDYIIIAYKEGDISGDGKNDHVYLIGNRLDIKSSFLTDLTLLIQDGDSGKVTKIPLEENAGYNPTVFLGDFTGDRVNDILVSIDSGGSGGYAFYYVYTFVLGNPKKIFDHSNFNEKYTYEIKYKDNYEVEVNTKDRKYILNILYKGPNYLSEIYNVNGVLKDPVTGWVNPLGGLYPIDFNRNGVFGLYATQRVAGRYNADNLGYIQTSLNWNGKEFVPFFQTLGI